MNPTFMRAVDNTVGVGLCWLVTLADRLRRLLTRQDPDRQTPPQRVLVIKLLGLGTILLTPAMLRPLRRLLPGAQIDFLTFEGFRAAVELTGCADDLYLLSQRSPWSFVTSTWRVLRQLRANRYDIVIDLDYFARFTMLLSYLIGSPRRAGFHSDGSGDGPPMYRGDLLTERMSYSMHRQIVATFHEGAELVAGKQTEKVVPECVIPQGAMTSGRQILGRNGLDESRPLVLLNPNVSAFSASARRWGAGKFADLAGRCLRELDVQVAFIGSAGEVDYVASIIAAIEGGERKAVSLAGQTTLHELAAVSRFADCMVSCDTGPMILASMAGTPVVVILGPTAWTHKPVGERNAVVCAELECSPCLTVYNQKHARCVHGTNVCMQQVGVDEVFEGLQRVLRGEARD